MSCLDQVVCKFELICHTLFCFPIQFITLLVVRVRFSEPGASKPSVSPYIVLIVITVDILGRFCWYPNGANTSVPSHSSHNILSWIDEVVVVSQTQWFLSAMFGREQNACIMESINLHPNCPSTFCKPLHAQFGICEIGLLSEVNLHPPSLLHTDQVVRLQYDKEVECSTLKVTSKKVNVQTTSMVCHFFYNLLLICKQGMLRSLL